MKRSRAECQRDRDVVDAVREWLGLAPLYRDSGGRRVDAERFDRGFYVQSADRAGAVFEHG
jgi:hypothetical protein